MKNYISFLVFALVISFTSSAFAASSNTTLKNWELRIHFGKLVGAPTAFSDKMTTNINGSPSVEAPGANVIDLGYRLTSTPLLFGIRYEIILGEKSTSATVSNVYQQYKTKLSGYRIGAFVDWRFLQFSQGYLGALVHVGPTHALTYMVDNTTLATNTVTHYEYKGVSSTGYSAGLDGGFILQQLYTLGIEVGYTSFVSNTVQDSANADLKDSAGENVKLDLSGMYYRASVGFTF